MRFSVGETVWYHGKKAKVVAYVGGGEKRYYVDSVGYRWSVPEIYLFKSNIRRSRTLKIQYEPSKADR